MNRNPLCLTLVLVIATFALDSCSGISGGNVCTTGCTNGNANLSLSVFDAPPAGASFLSFNTPIIAITLTPQSGTDVNIFSPVTPDSLDLTRLQSDSAFLGTFHVTPGTYTKINVFLGSISSVFANTSNSAIGACAALSVCNLNSGSPGSVSFTFATPLVLTANTNPGLGIEFNLNNIVTAANGITIDFTQPNVLTAVSLPRTGQASGSLETIEDFTGVITTFSGSNVTVTSATRGTLTGAVSSSTTYTGLLSVNSVCGGSAPTASCLAINKTVSVDATISTAGVVTLTVVDFLDDPSADEVEGIIYPTTVAGTYGMVVSDVVNATSNSLLTPVGSGSRISVTLDSAATFAVDTRNLLVSTPGGFSSASDVFPGQHVMLHVKSAATGTVLNVVADRLVLRYSRLTGTINTVSGNAFTVQNLPPFLGTFKVPPGVLTFPGVTTLDNFSALSDLATGNPTVSFRALYLNPNTAANGQPFMAAKVRKH